MYESEKEFTAAYKHFYLQLLCPACKKKIDSRPAKELTKRSFDEWGICRRCLDSILEELSK